MKNAIRNDSLLAICVILKRVFLSFFFSVGSHTAPIGEAITRGLIDSRQGNRSASRSGSPWHIRASSCNRTTGRNSLTPWPITRVGLKSPFECFASVSGLMERARLGSVPLGLGSPRSIPKFPNPFPRISNALIRDKCNNNSNNNKLIIIIIIVSTTLLSRGGNYTQKREELYKVRNSFLSLSLFFLNARRRSLWLKIKSSGRAVEEEACS